MQSITKFLLELGEGFAFVGQEYNLPIGVSQYHLDKLLPDSFKSTLPSIEEIESELRNS
ncbi:DUF1016 domain-containing protein [bacterium]|nr:DUF1016 domain-containing protein [bacterium]